MGTVRAVQIKRVTNRHVVALSGVSTGRCGVAGYAVLTATFALASVVGAQGLGEAQLLPFGEFAARDGRPGPGKTWKVTNDTGRLLATQLNAIAAQTPVVIDYEHQTLTAAEKGHLAPAAGWIQSAEWRDGLGLFAKVQWTAAAKARIDAGEYRYISPVIVFDDSGAVVSVLMASLLNYPALLGMDPTLSSALSSFSGVKPQPTEPHMNREALCALLGLSTDATDAQINTAVAALAGELPKLRADAAALQTAQAALAAKPGVPSAVVAALGLNASASEEGVLSAISALRGGNETAALVTALTAQVAELSGRLAQDEVKTVLDTAISEGRVLPALRDQYTALGKTNLAQLKAIIAASPVIEGLSGQSGGVDRGGSTAALAADTAAVIRQFGLSAEQFAAAAPKTA